MSDSLGLRLLPDGEERLFDGAKPLVVGRDDGADVVVADSRASRRHAVLRRHTPEGWVWEDHSANGTFREGVRIERLAIAEPVTLLLGSPTDGAQVALRPIGRPRPPSSAGQIELGAFSSTHEPSATVRLGRSPDNDIVLDDLLVSRHHAELRHDDRRGYYIVDLQSHNGTFVDGRRVQRRSALRPESVISIGHHLFRLAAGRLEEYVDTGEVSFAALDLSVRLARKLLLDDVSFALDAGTFLAVLGPTGAGKTTLLRALIGSRPADRGRVLYNGRDLYGGYAELRNRIGYVPQDDILHPQLTIRSALGYAAQLRFPLDVTSRERAKRVDDVMAELGLSERADLQISKLSGGQRKRTSVALELLTRPSLLLLDEPTSGLDPGYEKSVMELLRSLADGGRTVITVTHSIQSLDRCDRTLFLAPGGQTAYFGPPDEALGFFREPQYADVFQQLDRAAPGAARAAFAGSPAEDDYVKVPLGPHRALGPGGERRPGAGRGETPSAPPNNPSWAHQFQTLLRRYIAVIVADRRNTLLLLAQAPILGLLMLLVFGQDSLAFTPASRGTAGSVLVGLVLGATYLGAANSIREIVKERNILTRERAVGLSPTAYVLSKAAALGVLTIVQAVVLVLLGLARAGGPGQGSVLSSGRLEVFIVVSLTGLAAMALGLFISALVSNADKALTILPVILFAQFLLTGAVFNLQDKPGLNELGYLTGARWGYSALASTSSLDALQGAGCNGSTPVAPQASLGPASPGHATVHLMASTTPSVNTSCDFAHQHSASIWALDVSMLVLLTAVALLGASLVLRPVGQPQRRSTSSWFRVAR